MTGILHLLLHILIFSGTGTALYAIRWRLGLIPFYIYLGILQVFTSLMSSFYVLDLGNGIEVGGGSIAYAAVLWSVMLLYVVERDLSTIKVTILGLLAVQVVFLILYPYYGFLLGFEGITNPLNVPGELFGISFGIFWVGNLLAFAEMVLMIFFLEKIRERMPNLPAIVNVVAVYVLMLLADAVLFPAFAFPVIQSISIVQGISSILSKLLLGLGYGAMLVFASFIMKSHYLQDPNGAAVEFRDMFTLPKSEVIRAWLEAEENQRRVGLLLDLITHDIQNTTNKVIQIIELAQLKAQDKNEQLPKELFQILEIERESTNLIDNFLTLSIIENEELKKQTIPLLDILLKAKWRVEVLHTDTELSLRGETKLKDVTVESHRLLESVFHNLLTNMMKYRKSGQDEVIVEITCEKQNGKIHLILMDSGIGMSEEQKTSAFDSLKKRPRHRNFGLYLTHEIITRLDGAIWIDNRPDSPDDHRAGTAFHILLPIGS